MDALRQAALLSQEALENAKPRSEVIDASGDVWEGNVTPNLVR